jgi:hypothetical protein
MHEDKEKMPADWLSPLLGFLSAISWPATLLFPVFIFRQHIGRFIDEISEVTGFGTNAKRSAILMSQDLAAATSRGSDEEVSNDEPTASPADTDTSDKSSSELLLFLREQIESNLRWAQQNCSGASSAVRAEIIRSTYTDLRLAVRMVGYTLGGTKVVAGKSLKHSAPHIILQRVGAPTDLVEFLRRVRTFSTQVRGNELQANEQAARNYIDSLIEINQSLFGWYEEVAAKSHASR